MPQTRARGSQESVLVVPAAALVQISARRGVVVTALRAHDGLCPVGVRIAEWLVVHARPAWAERHGCDGHGQQREHEHERR